MNPYKLTNKEYILIENNSFKIIKNEDDNIIEHKKCSENVSTDKAVMNINKKGIATECGWFWGYFD